MFVAQIYLSIYSYACYYISGCIVAPLLQGSAADVENCDALVPRTIAAAIVRSCHPLLH